MIRALPQIFLSWKVDTCAENSSLINANVALSANRIEIFDRKQLTLGILTVFCHNIAAQVIWKPKIALFEQTFTKYQTFPLKFFPLLSLFIYFHPCPSLSQVFSPAILLNYDKLNLFSMNDTWPHNSFTYTSILILINT